MQILPTHTRDWWLLVAAILLTIGIGIYAVYTNQILQTQLQVITADNQERTEQIAQLDAELRETREELEETEEDLEEAEDRNEEFEDQIDEINETVGEISRYTYVDPELLKKYSRVFFLSENYAPTSLTQIDDDWLHDDESLLFHRDAYPFLEEMLEDAEDDDIDLRIISAYRSFQTQQNLNDRYTVTYGAGTANEFSAEQGYSEHQLGTTVDFTTPELGNNFNNFGTTEAFAWLENNAHEYGFVLSYPEGNQYYQYEPWHWRFVGIELAEDLEDAGDNFYDWEQRRIDEYRADVFED